MSKDLKKIETIAIHAGMEPHFGSRSIVPPMELSTNYEHDEHGFQEGDLIYTRYENPNRLQLENVLSQLEQGEAAAAFASGVAAIGAVFQALPKQSHILLPSDIYHGTRTLLQNFADRWSLEYSFTDFTDLEDITDSIRANTKMLFVETPSNPMLNITDIEKVCNLAAMKKILVCVDNTWPTPFNLRPIVFGADIVIHSTTKYLGGHSDLLGGAIIAKSKNGFFEEIRKIQRSQGAVPSPRDCWMLSRSIRSFPYRMRAHNQNAMEIARYLESHPKIEKVFYPGLESHKGHEIARSQMEGFGGMISFLFAGDSKETLKIVSKTKIISRATSLGGIESTWEHRKSSEGESSKTPENLVRFSVGLEHVDDLKSDLKQALG